MVLGTFKIYHWKYDPTPRKIDQQIAKRLFRSLAKLITDTIFQQPIAIKNGCYDPENGRQPH